MESPGGVLGRHAAEMGHEGSHPLMATRAAIKLPKQLAELAHGSIVASSDPALSR
jgi:hypothetical protein